MVQVHALYMMLLMLKLIQFPLPNVLILKGKKKLKFIISFWLVGPIFPYIFNVINFICPLIFFYSIAYYRIFEKLFYLDMREKYYCSLFLSNSEFLT